MTAPTTPTHTTYNERIKDIADLAEHFGLWDADDITEHSLQQAYDKTGAYYTALEIGLAGPYDEGQTTLLWVTAIADDPESGIRLQGRTGNGVITYEIKLDNTTPTAIFSATVGAALTDLLEQITD